MGRRADVPELFGRVNEAGTTPVPAVLAVGSGIAALTLIGDVKTTWSFSTFIVLVYYAITNLSALYIPPRTGSTRPGSPWRASWRAALFVTPWIWGTGEDAGTLDEKGDVRTILHAPPRLLWNRD